MILLTILELATIYLPLVLGAYCAFSLLKVPFLALEACYVFGAIAASKFIISTSLPSPLSLLCSLGICLLSGMMVGFITCSIKKYVQVSFLLASIITLGFFHGATLWIAGSSHLSLYKKAGFLFLLPSVEQYPYLTTIGGIALFTLFCFQAFMHSSIGVSCAIYGDNPQFFSHYFISSSFIEYAGICVSGSLAALSGFLQATVNGFADISMGMGISLLCITMLILGQMCSNKKLSLLLPLAGLFSYLALQQLLLRMHFDTKYFTAVQAIIVCALLYGAQLWKKEKLPPLGL